MSTYKPKFTYSLVYQKGIGQDALSRLGSNTFGAVKARSWETTLLFYDAFVLLK